MSIVDIGMAMCQGPQCLSLMIGAKLYLHEAQRDGKTFLPGLCANLRPVCTKTNNGSFFLPGNCSPRLLAYRDLIPTLVNPLPVLNMIKMLRFWVAMVAGMAPSEYPYPTGHQLFLNMCLYFCSFFILLQSQIWVPGPRPLR